MPSTLDELLIFGRNTDELCQLNQMTCCDKTVLLIVEFCQVQGPKPLTWLPRDLSGTHLDLDQTAIWLMSFDNVHGSFSSIYNQQLGLHCLIQHATLFDVAARAFQRPFAIALLTPKQPTPSYTLEFRRLAIDLLQPLLGCNRRYFLSFTERLSSIHSDSLRVYDNNLPAQPSPEPQCQIAGKTSSFRQATPSNRVKAIAQQANVWARRLLKGDHQLSALFAGRDSCRCLASDEDIVRSLSLIDRFATAELTPLFELAPCVGALFVDGMREAYTQLTATPPIKGLLFSNKTPVLRSFFGANAQLVEGEGTKEEDEEAHQNLFVLGQPRYAAVRASENSLTGLGSNGAVQCMFALLAATGMVTILAGKQTEFTGMDLLDKLNLLRLGRRLETVKWNTEASAGSSFISGIRCAKELSGERPISGDSAVIDLNRQQMRSRRYEGRLLSPLLVAFRKVGNFPSDKAALAALAATITDITQLTLLVKYASFHAVVNRFGLSASDQLILINFLAEQNLTRYSHLKVHASHLGSSLPIKTTKLG